MYNDKYIFFLEYRKIFTRYSNYSHYLNLNELYLNLPKIGERTMIVAIILMILAICCVNAIFEKYAFDKLYYYRNFSKSIVEIDEEFEIEVIVENRKKIPVTFVQIEEKLPSELRYKSRKGMVKISNHSYHRGVMSILPNQRIKRNYKCFFNKRGKYSVQEVTMMAGDLVGLKNVYKNIVASNEIIVLPKRYDIDNNIVPYGGYNGNFTLKRQIIDDPTLIVGVREYTGYEPQNTIHWPSSLKTGKMMVKKFDYTSDNKAVILLNIETSKPFWEKIDGEAVEKSISICRSITEEIEAAGIPFAFSTNARLRGNFNSRSYVHFGTGSTHLYSVLESLGKIDYDVSDEFEEYIHKSIYGDVANMTYIIVTSKLFDEYIDQINDLELKCAKVIVISLSEMNIEELNRSVVTFVVRGDE